MLFQYGIWYFYELEKKLFVTPAEYMPQRNLILASFLYVIGISGMIEFSVDGIVYCTIGDAQFLHVWRAHHMRITPVTLSQTWNLQILIHNTVWQPIW